MTKERPILFSGEMVRAILAGQKTQTRRVIKFGPYQDHEIQSVDVDGFVTWSGWSGLRFNRFSKPCQVGQRLWVKETFYPMPHLNSKAYYRASDSLVGVRWKPSIFMPRALSRITLEVIEVGVERLQDISEEDAIAEGVKPLDGDKWDHPTDAFFELWERINGKGSVEKDPWVWVIKFKKL